MKENKGKIMIIIAILVCIFGIGLIAILKNLVSKNTSSTTDEYICVSKEVNGRIDEFSIRYINDTIKTVKMSSTIKGPNQINDDGVVNNSEERIAYEELANNMYFSYETFKNIKGYIVELTEANGVAIGSVTLDYSLVNEKDIGQLFASKDENIKNYIQRLEKSNYTCMKKTA